MTGKRENGGADPSGNGETIRRVLLALTALVVAMGMALVGREIATRQPPPQPAPKVG